MLMVHFLHIILAVFGKLNGFVSVTESLTCLIQSVYVGGWTAQINIKENI